MTLLERQQARFKWLLQQCQQEEENNYVKYQYNSLDQFHGFFDHDSMNGDMIDWKKKLEMYMGKNGLPKNGGFSLFGTEFVANNKMDSLEVDHCLSRTSSCQIGAAEAAKTEGKVVAVKVAGEDVTLMENIKQSSNGSRDNSNKRKAEFVAAEEYDNKIKEVEVESTNFSRFFKRRSEDFNLT